MSNYYQNAEWIASWLELERDPERMSWAGRVDGLKVRVDALAQIAEMREYQPGVRIAVTLPRSLRVGCIVCRGPSEAPLDGAPAVRFFHAKLDTFLVMGAAEPEVARAIFCACADDIAALLGSVRITDRTIELVEGTIFNARVFLQQVPSMIALARRLVRERAEWEARHETWIAPIWSELATETGLAWDADRMRVEGELHGARIDARVEAHGCSLSARMRARWPSLGRGLGAAWRAGFDHEYPAIAALREWPDDAAPSFDTERALKVIASSGAGLTLDDEGAVVHLDHVHVTALDLAEPMRRTFRALLTLARELQPTPTTAGIYR